MTRLLAAAERYAGHGWYVLPVYGIVDSQCSCGKGENCPSPGKHPRIGGWQNQATTDVATIRRWWQKWPHANIGIVAGKSGLVVLDIDPKHGGTDSLDQLIAEHGILPDTREQITGGGGRHILFKHPGGQIQNRQDASALAPGIDTKGDAGFFVAAPSLHSSEKRYQWDGLEDLGIAELPDWLKGILVGSSSNGEPNPTPAAKKFGEGQRHAALLSYAGKLRRTGCGLDEVLSALLDFNRQRCDPPKDEAIVRKLAEDVTRRYEPQDDEPAIDALAALSVVEYERRREGAARELGMRVSVLDAQVKHRRSDTGPGSDGHSGTLLEFSDPEPWPEPANGAQVLDRIAEAVTRHVVLAPHCAEAVALWIMFAHCHDSAGISPILAITSPVPGCGKTTLLTLISALTPHPLPVSNITPAALFRSVEKWQPTLLIDEADSFLKGNEDLRGILDSGHSRAMGFVVRTVGEDLEPRKFSTWCPKVIAAIGRLAPTLVSRSICIRMQRKPAGDKVVSLRADKLGHLTPLTRQAWRWRLDNSEKLDDDPKLPEALHGRTADNWRHLIAIADAAGGRWPQAARQAAAALEVGDDSEPAAVLLLEDISGLFSKRETDRLSSSEIVAELARMEDRPWPEWSKEKPISTRQVARLLKGFNIQPRTIRREGADPAKGYYHTDFTDALVRYSPSRSVTPLQANRYGDYSDFQSVTSELFVTDRNDAKPNKTGVCNGVTDEYPQKPDEARKKVQL